MPAGFSGFRLVPEFFPQAAALRARFDAHFADPYAAGPQHDCWTWWHVPGEYCYLRTHPRNVIGQDMTDAFMAHMRAWARREISPSAEITVPWISGYVDGCGQELHTDNWRGGSPVFRFVWSFTRWAERRGIGGETLVWRLGSENRAMQGADALKVSMLHEIIEPAFNRLIVLDGRLPHAVRFVRGSVDPRDMRVVLQGDVVP